MKGEKETGRKRKKEWKEREKEGVKTEKGETKKKVQGGRKSSGINRQEVIEKLEADGYGWPCPMTHSLLMTHE